MIHTVKGFSIVNEAEVGVFLELSCFFSDPTDVGNLISGSSAFSKSNLHIWKFLVQVLLKPSFWALPCYHVKWVQLCGSLNIFGIDLLWDWNESWLFPKSLAALGLTWHLHLQMSTELSGSLVYLSQHLREVKRFFTRVLAPALLCVLCEVVISLNCFLIWKMG